jgi:uncharacterized membrane protein
MTGEIVATIWRDEAIGLIIIGLLSMIVAPFICCWLLFGFGSGIFILTILLMYVEKLRKRPDADKFKFMTYYRRVFK